MAFGVVMHETVFEGRDVALSVLNRGHSVSIVTFEPRNKYFRSGEKAKFSSGFGAGRFEPMGVNEFLVRINENHWYQTPEMFHVAEIINEVTSNGRVITYGVSMGGFGAINFSSLLNADCFIGLSPLFDVGPHNVLGDSRWAIDQDHVTFNYNLIRAGACRNSKGYVFFDENSPDKGHADLIERKTAATLVPIQYGGHPCSFYLNDAYKIKKIIGEVIRDEFKIGKFYEELDVGTRKTHYPYWREGKRLAAAGDSEGAIYQYRLSVNMKSDVPGVHAELGNLLLSLGDLDGAEDSLLRAIALKPNATWSRVRLSYVYAGRRDFDKAVSIMQKAIEFNSGNSAYHARLGEWQIKAGDLRGAFKSMQTAITLAPQTKKFLVRIAEIKKRLQ